VTDAEKSITVRLEEIVGWLLSYRSRPDRLPTPEGFPLPQQLPADFDPTRIPHRHEWPEEPSTEWGYKLAIRMLGFALHAVGGVDAMRRACDALDEKHGGRGISIVDSAWNGIGHWAS
jgi:hypothetical protein